MRCPKGFKQDPPKSGNCVKKSVKKRCPNGTRKKKGECVPNTRYSSPMTPYASPLNKYASIHEYLEKMKANAIKDPYQEYLEHKKLNIINPRQARYNENLQHFNRIKRIDPKEYIKQKKYSVRV